ncbi:MAG TPA: NAD-dependent epimerase/dehydratase family protein [Candidatus Sulfotelmatobacter sp.]|nr:NAD-dependent epimerase/dehydratase family protein [Candidatus Sulfotelmatobacter sp.]
MHILVTGGCGFIGSHVARHLREKGNQVSVMDNLVRRGSERNLSVLARRGIHFFHGDVRNPEDLANLPTGIELICDTSAQPSVVTGYANPLFDLTNNGIGAIRILEYARPRKIPLVFWSSNRVYGADRLNALPRRETSTRFEYDPEAWARIPIEERPAGFDPHRGVSEQFSIDGGQRSIYGLSKLIADAACQEYAQAYDLPIVVNRFGVISGAGQFGHTDQGWVVWWAVAHWFKLPLTYIGFQGKQVRDVLFIEDMLELLGAQISRIGEFRGEVFNLGGGAANSISLCEATKAMQEISGRSTPITISDEPRKGDILLYWTDNRKAAERLNWQPRVDLRTGFKHIFEWIRDNEAELRSHHVK